MIPPDHLIEVLSRRHDILRSLRDDPKERHVLVDYLDDSKSTVYKGVSQLRELGLIKSTSDGLQPTLFGVIALNRYDELAHTATFGELLVDLPPDAIHPAAFDGAEVVRPDITAVDRHLARLEAMLRNADSIRGFSPAISPDYVSLLHHRIVTNELTAEVILPEEIMIDLRRAYPDIAADLVSAANATLYRTDDELPFTLVLATAGGESEVVIELGDEGLAAGLIINDSSECLRWAETTFDRYQQTAERVTD